MGFGPTYHENLVQNANRHTNHQRIQFFCPNAWNTFSNLSLCTTLCLSIGTILYRRAIYCVGVSQYGLGHWSKFLEWPIRLSCEFSHSSFGAMGKTIVDCSLRRAAAFSSRKTGP